MLSIKKWMVLALAFSIMLFPVAGNAQSGEGEQGEELVTFKDKNGNIVQIGDGLPKAKKKSNDKNLTPPTVESGPNGELGTLGVYREATVAIAVDEEYRAAYPDWQSRTSQIVEYADNGFYRDHNINLIVYTYIQWHSDGSNASQILADLDREWNIYNYDFLIGFTKDANFEAGGIAYVYSGDPSGMAVSVNLDQGITNTWHAAQHELSHNYGLSHDASGSGIQCIMNYDYAYSVDYWDASHDQLIENHGYWYGS